MFKHKEELNFKTQGKRMS